MAVSGIMNGKYKNCLDFVLEGGSIESDGCGTLLTTTACLTAPNRNEPLSKDQIEEHLKQEFNLKQVLWLDHGYLAGDDTDSHIDTLARFCPEDTIVYVQCSNNTDEHFDELKKMEEQLKSFRTLKGEPYRLIPLPMADPVFEDGERLPATYANFLIMNEAVLYPTYNQPKNDTKAAEQLKKAFPTRNIIGINCEALEQVHKYWYEIGSMLYKRHQAIYLREGISVRIWILRQIAAVKGCLLRYGWRVRLILRLSRMHSRRIRKYHPC